MIVTAAILDRVETSGPFAETRPLRLAEVELAAPRPGELLVRIDAAGICHSDLSVINGDRPRPTPMALGHEAVGTVVEAPGVVGISVGDRVVLTFLPSCGQCADCASGHGYLCGPASAANGVGDLLQGGRRLSEQGHHLHHHLGVSAFATHAVVDARSAVRIDPDIPPQIAALFGCAVLTGVGAVLNTAALRPGQSLAVFGLGGVGLSAVLGGLAGGAGTIIAVDPVAEKRAVALDLGVTAAIAPDEAVDRIRDLTGGGADIVVETAGHAAVLEQAYAAARRGGTIVTAGLPHPSQMLSIPAASLVADVKTLKGSYMGSSIPARDIPAYIALWRAGRLPVEKLLTGTGPLGDVNRMMDDLAAGRAIRQVLIP